MKTKTYLSVALLAASLISTLAVTGCVSKSTVTSGSTESTGQQLIDLKKAYADGDITKEQYEKLQKKLVSKND